MSSQVKECLRVQGERNATKIFIVDDSAIVLERLVTLLTAIPDIEIVGQAANIKEAKQLVSQLHPDVVILDIQMPGGSGIKLLQQLKKEPDCPRILMITGSAFPQYRKKCLAAGADYFFDKSTEFEQLLNTVSNLIPQFAASPKASE